MTIRYVMAGGGPGAMIGEAHRVAARAAGFELVGGAFSSDLDRSRAQAAKSRLPESAAFGDWQAMIAGAAQLGADAVVIVTPNHLHAPIALAALEAGLHVICDKPLCVSVAEADRIAAAARTANRIVGVTYTYAGYASLREAARRVQAGVIGQVRLIVSEFIQDWLLADGPQPVWRMDPERSGPSGAVADIGTHVFHMAGFVSGLAPTAVSAELTSFVAGRRLDDTGLLRLRYANGARAALTVTQAALASGGGLRFEIMGDQGGLSWRLSHPHELVTIDANRARAAVTIETPGPLPEVPGAPRGYLNAFAQLYVDFAAAIRGKRVSYPGIEDGRDGMRFIEAAVASAAKDGVWTGL